MSNQVNNAPQGSVTIVGSAREGEKLWSVNTLSDDDGIGIVSFQWKRAGSSISGATGSTYVLTQEDVGSPISVTASYIDGGGTAESVSSRPTSPVLGSIPSVPPSLTVSYGAETINDGDVVAAGEGISVTGTNLVTGVDYTFRALISVDGGEFRPTMVDTDQGKRLVFTLTSDNPTFSESDYSFGELKDIQSREYQFYIQRVESDGNGNGGFQPTQDQFSGVGQEETSPIVFTVIDDEYVAPVVFNPPSDPIKEVYEVQVQNYQVSETVLSRLNDFDIESLEDIGYTFETVSDDDFNIVTEQTGDQEMVGTPYEVQRDWISGGKASLYQQGFRGDDLIQAGQGDDIVRGGKGNDVLIGGAGDDVIYDDLGNDLMIGAAGRDEFRVGNGYNVIVDFETEFDTLVVENGSDFTLHEVSGGTLIKYDDGETFLSGLTDTSVLV